MALFVLLGALVWLSYSSCCFFLAGSWGPTVLFCFPSHPSPPFAQVSEEGGLGWIGVGDWRKVPLLERLGGRVFLFFFCLGIVFVFLFVFVLLLCLLLCLLGLFVFCSLCCWSGLGVALVLSPFH